MKKHIPLQRSILLTYGIMPVPCFYFLEHICRLLDDQWHLKQEDSLFPFKIPCTMQIEIDVRDDLNQSWFLFETKKAKFTICIPSGFINSIHTDMRRNVNVKHFILKVAWFKLDGFSKTQSWHHLNLLLISKSRTLPGMQFKIYCQG